MRIQVKFIGALAAAMFLETIAAAPTVIETSIHIPIPAETDTPISSAALSGISARQQPPNPGRKATVYRDNHGGIKVVMAIVLDAKQIEVFKDSGINLSKEVFNEARRWMMAQGTAWRAMAISAVWSGQLNERSRYLSKQAFTAHYGFFSVQVKTFPEYVVNFAKMLSEWISTNGNGVVIVNLGDGNALTAHNGPRKREGDEVSVAEEEDIDDDEFVDATGQLDARQNPDWCAAPNLGLGAHWIQITDRTMGYEANMNRNVYC